MYKKLLVIIFTCIFCCAVQVFAELSLLDEFMGLVNSHDKASLERLEQIAEHAYEYELPIMAESALYSDPGYLRSKKVGIVVYEWGQKDLRAAHAWANRIDDAKIRRTALIMANGAIRNAARQNPGGAMVFALTIKSAKQRNQAIERVAQGWISADMQGAVDQLRSMTGKKEQLAFLKGMSVEWAKKDPRRAAEFVDTLEQTTELKNICYDIANYWAHTDIGAALAWAETIPLVTNREYILGTVLTQWSAQDPVSAMKYILALPPSLSQSTLMSKVFNKSLSGDDRIVMHLLEMVPEFQQVNLVSSNIGVMLKKQPQLAAMAVEVMPAGPRRTEPLGQIAGLWLRQNRSAALQWMMSLTDAGDRAAAFMQADEWIKDNPLDAGEYILGTEQGTHWSRMVSKYITHWSRYDYDSALKWVDEHVPEPDRFELYEPIIYSMCLVEPEAAINLLLSIPDIDDSNPRLGRILSIWAVSEPQKAFDWATNLRSENARNAAYSHMVVSLAHGNLDLAKQAALSITHPPVQRHAVRRLVNSWSDLDPTAAGEFMQQFEQ